MTFTVVNNGERGLVYLNPWITTSEGEWSRQQTLTMQVLERREFSYFFQEPSINATNIQWGVRYTPN